LIDRLRNRIVYQADTQLIRAHLDARTLTHGAVEEIRCGAPQGDPLTAGTILQACSLISGSVELLARVERHVLLADLFYDYPKYESADMSAVFYARRVIDFTTA